MRIRPFSTHLLLLVLASTQAARVLYDRTLHHTSSTQKVPVLVGYKRTPGHLFNFTSLQVDLVELESLEQDPDIDFIEVDPVVSLYGEVYTYGPSVVGAYDSQLPSMSGTTADCNDPNSFKIALIDSGMYVNHPDLACSSLNCIGKEFGTALEEGAKWNAPISPHGTLVAGIIGASRDNGLGIRGIVDGQTVCWIVGRVFGDSSPDSFLSPVLEAVQWAVSKGARVMNLSLGGLSYTQTGADLYQDLFDMGLLIVAAAGNKGNSENSYPASYPTVMGVGAVDASLQRAPFSQFNDNVNVVAPGSRIFSTAPILQDQPTRFRQAMLHLDGVTALMLEEFSFTADYTNLTGTLADCGAGTSTCGGGSGNRICVFDYSSNMDLTNCQGVAALVLATDQYPTFPTMQPSNVKIPVFEMTKSAGEALTMGSTVRLEKAWGYLTSDGTSFAAPFVAGTAAAVWQQCPVCTNAEVFECLQKAAVDLGASGKDVEYGHGLVQVDETHTCLVNAGCCREDATPAPTPVPDPTLPPLECSTAESDMKQCLVQADDLCEPCVASYFPANYWLLSCDVYEQNVCDGLRNCVCEPCREEVIRHYDCIKQTQGYGGNCGIACPEAAPAPEPTTPQPTPLPTPAPTRSCPDEFERYRTCFTTQMTPDEETNCKTCVNNIVPSDIVVCDTLGDTVCGAIYQRCQCGPCVSEIESYLACAFEEKDGCSFDCASSLTEAPTVSPTPKPTEAATFAPTVAATVAQTKSPTTSPTVSPTASPTVSPTLAPTTKSPTKSPTVSPTTKSPTLPPTPSPTSKQCNNEQINYQGCFDSFLTSDDQETCMSCIQESLPPANSDCGDVEYSSCVATQQCQACGVCKRYVGAYVSCFYEVEFGCTIDCANVEYPTPTPFPTAAPTTLPATAAPTSGQVCPEEFEAYKGCFADTMTEEQEEECKACVNSALPDGRFECEVLRDSACQAVYSICNCGSCQPEIAGFLRCAYKENTGCSMDCSGVLTVGVDPSEYRTCSLERSSFMGCYASQLNVEESAACSSCASGWMFPITTQSLSEAGDYCDEMQARICSSLETCDCGVCSDSLAALQECELEEQAASCPDIDCESFQEEAGSTDVPLPESDTANPNTPTAPTMGSSSSEGVLNRVQAAVLLLLSSSLLLTS